MAWAVALRAGGKTLAFSKNKNNVNQTQDLKEKRARERLLQCAYLPKITPRFLFYYLKMAAHLSGNTSLKLNFPSAPFTTVPFSVTMASIKECGVTSNAGFQTPMR